jgi:TPR repeat protein
MHLSRFILIAVSFALIAQASERCASNPVPAKPRAPSAIGHPDPTLASADRHMTVAQRAMFFDYADAAASFRFEAERGESRAQGLLGLFYYDGTGVDRDLVEAYKWFTLAAEHGDKYVTEMRDSVAAEMTSCQRAEARQLAKVWRVKKNHATMARVSR